MTKHTFGINYPYDEDMEFYVDGEQIAYANHDEHGWVGMEAMKDLFENIADKFGIEVEELDIHDEDE